MTSLKELYDPDEWEECMAGDIDIRPPEISPLVRLERGTRMRYAGLRVKLRVMERLLEETRDLEAVVYWIAQIAKVKRELGIEGDESENMSDL